MTITTNRTSTADRYGDHYRNARIVSRHGCLLLTSVLLVSVLLAQPPRIQAQESAADKAKREDIQRRNAQIEEQNRKITAINETVKRTFTGGNEALRAGRYDEAIAQYNEGLAADPEQIALWTNKSIALRMRGVKRFNATFDPQQVPAANAKTEREVAKKEMRESFEAGTRAVALLKTQPANEQNKYSAVSARAEAARILAKWDFSIGEVGFAAIQEYVAIEPDEGKRMQAQLNGAQLLFDSGEFARAVVEFRKLVVENSYNFDALLGLGLSLYGTDNKSNMTEATKTLQRFLEIAPATHPKRKEVIELLQALKQQP